MLISQSSLAVSRSAFPTTARPRQVSLYKYSCSNNTSIPRNATITCSLSGDQPQKKDGVPVPYQKSVPVKSAGSAPRVDIEAGSGLALLLLVNAAVYAAATYMSTTPAVVSLMSNMVLPARDPLWWQFATSTLCHASWEHLSRNLFVCFVAGNILQRDILGVGVWFAYLLSGIGANVACYYFLPFKAKAAGALVGIGATGGTFGLLVVALMLSIRFRLSWLIGAAAIGQYVIQGLLASPVPGVGFKKLWQTALAPRTVPAVGQMLTSASSGGNISYSLVWMLGAAAGAVVVVLLAKIPDDGKN